MRTAGYKGNRFLEGYTAENTEGKWMEGNDGMRKGKECKRWKMKAG